MACIIIQILIILLTTDEECRLQNVILTKELQNTAILITE